MSTSDPFSAHRSLLFTVSYEMLGSAADAEDVLQEVWLRWSEVDTAEVRDPRAYLVRMATRLSLNRLRTLARRREDYVGTWLPEPVLTAPDVAQDVELADSVSTAMLLVLETLPPTERAVFVLREVFDVPYAEAMTATPPEVTDEMVASLDRQLGHAAVVELTMMVAIENERSRFNSAMGLASQGFSDVCELPLAQAGTIGR